MPTKNTSLILDEAHQRFVTKMVDSGHYANASEVMREALRELEVRKTREEILAKLIREGEESGEPLDGETVMAELLAELDRG